MEYDRLIISKVRQTEYALKEAPIPFRIRCTTCRTGLVVRQASLLGQILPCPKCGGMVLISAPTNEAVEAPSTAPRAGQAAATSALGSFDSFDNIDELLDGEPPAPKPSSRAGTDKRWRTRDDNTSDVVPARDLNEPGQLTLNSNIAQPNLGDDDGEDAFDSTDTDPASGDWLANKTSPLRGYLMAGIGAAVGLGLAAAMAGLLIRSLQAPSDAESQLEVSRQPSVERLEEPAETTQNDLDGEETPTVARQETETAPVGPDRETIEATVAQQDNLAVEPSALISLPVDAPAGSDELAASTDSSPEPPAPIETPAAEEVSTGDELADFAAWLQDPEASPSTSTEPATDEDPSENNLSNVPADGGANVPAQPEIVPSKTPPSPVNVEARLKQRISAISLDDVPLTTAVRLLTDVTTVPISIDPAALRRRNLRSNVGVSAKLRNAPLQVILESITAELKLHYRVLPGQVIITTLPEAKEQLVSVKHDVGDLVDGDPARVEALATWVQDLIAVGSWATHPKETAVDSSGNEAANEDPLRMGQCSANGTSLEVTHSDGVQFEVLALLEKLRRTRKLPQQTRVHADRTNLGARASLFSAASSPIRIRAADEQNIAGFAAAIEQQAGVTLLIDWASLYAAGWTPEDRQRVFFADRPLIEVLNSFLHVRGLAYRVIDRDTLEITTSERVHSIHDLEVYQLPTGVDLDAVKRLSQELVNRLGPLKFEPQGRGAIAFDPIGEALIVSLPQPDQIRVSELIDGFAW